MRRERADAALFRLAAGDPENIVETNQRPFRGIRIGSFGIVDEPDLARAPDIFDAMCETGEADNGGGNIS